RKIEVLENNINWLENKEQIVKEYENKELPTLPKKQKQSRLLKLKKLVKKMKLEYRVLELAKGNEQECHYCFVDYDDPTNLNFDTTPATHQMIAHTETEQYFDIAFICKDCKVEYDNGTLPRCEKCDRLKRNKSRCYCHKVKKKTTLPTERELISQSFSTRLENRTRELEKELSTAKEELKIEREEVAKFQEKSE